MDQLLVKSRAQWRKWLEDNHVKSKGIWVIRYKKGYKFHVPGSDIVEEALCFGWIDHRAKAVDEKKTALHFVPRREKSMWSKINKQRAESLIERGLMMEAGMKTIEQAKKNGRWQS